jgi:hypothetical protein
MAYITFQPSDYFNTKLYTGNGSTNAITGVGFQPDMCWWKMRSSTEEHALGDAVRAAGYIVKPNASDAQAQSASYFASFDSDGFTLGSDTKTNGNSSTYASWNWKANGAGSSNTDGTITSTVSSSTTSGFSVVKWTGSGGNATIGHGLGAVPKMIIIKSLANATSWMVYHSALGNNSEIYLNGNNAAAASSTAWQDTDPTSSVFYVAGGAGDGVNASGDYIAYCFAEKQGFSKFGSYAGNASADGTFVYTGFKPAFVILKNTATTDSWVMFDNKRPNPYNVIGSILQPNTNIAETANSAFNIDFVSTGFKIRGTDGAVNGSGNTIIFMAFAAAPLVSSNGVPATAR